jgi:hypothetical protein
VSCMNVSKLVWTVYVHLCWLGTFELVWTLYEFVWTCMSIVIYEMCVMCIVIYIYKLHVMSVMIYIYILLDWIREKNSHNFITWASNWQASCTTQHHTLYPGNEKSLSVSLVNFTLICY